MSRLLFKRACFNDSSVFCGSYRELSDGFDLGHSCCTHFLDANGRKNKVIR